MVRKTLLMTIFLGGIRIILIRIRIIPRAIAITIVVALLIVIKIGEGEMKIMINLMTLVGRKVKDKARKNK